MQDNLKMKEYLVPQEDGTYKLHLAYPLTAWKSWIEVPEGSDYLCEILGDLVFYKSGKVFKWWDAEYLHWNSCVDIVTDLTIEGILWKRQNDVEGLMTKDNQKFVDTQTLVDRSDLFDKIRKGEISFDFSEMKTERTKDTVERILGVQVDEFSTVDDKHVDWLEQRVKSNNKNRKTITVTITPNDVKTKWFEKFLHGVKVQCRVIGSKGWQNITWKSLEMMELNLEFREKPTTVEVDGMKFDTVDKLTSYLKSMTNLK